jgi:hypothetical protein
MKVSPSFWFGITLLPGRKVRIKASTLRYLTLEQAWNQKKVVVHETSQVNGLAVENNSAEAVFIQVGDIVKGGNEDRMIPNDFIIPPHSGKLPIAAFCVEQARWGRRGSEPTQAFAGSTESASARFEPKLMSNQMSVWNKVVELQEALASHLRKLKPALQTREPHNATGLGDVRSAASTTTSLLLTQTSPPVEKAVSAYTKVLAGAVQGHNDGTGHETNIRVDQRTQLVQQKTPHQLWTESRDGSAWVHRSVVTK